MEQPPANRIGLQQLRITCSACSLRELCLPSGLEAGAIEALEALEALSRRIPPLQQHFHRILSREIVRDHGMMLLLGSMRAEERLAAFLLNLSQRFAARGYSSTEFMLRMTREEIGRYLGVKLETVSRALTRLQANELIGVRNRQIRILSLEKLQAIASRNSAMSES